MNRSLTLDWSPLVDVRWIALAALVLCALIAWGARHLSGKEVPRRSVITLTLLRLASIALFVLCLLQPTVSYDRDRKLEPELIVLVDTSASMGTAERDVTGEATTRLKAALDAYGMSELPAALDRIFQVRMFGFDRRAFPLKSSELASLTASDATTDYAAGLSSVGDLLAAESKSDAVSNVPRRVLLVSDGLDHGTESLAEAAVKSGTIVDVWPVGRPSESESSGAAIFVVRAPNRVLLASETKFLATLRNDGGAGDYSLVMSEEGKEILQHDVTFAAGVREIQTEFVHRPTEVGLKRYEFELRSKNANAAPPAPTHFVTNVLVVDDKIEVLVLEDRWRWEFKYLKRVIEDDPSFNLTAMLSRGAAANLQLGEPEAKADLAGFPQSRAELDRFDVIVLGDVRPSRWPERLAGALADAVTEGGKSLIVLPGPALGETARIAELNALLPVELSVDSPSPIEGPIEIRLTPDGARSGMFRDADRRLFAGSLPNLDRIYAPLRKRPAASVLVEAATKGNASGPLIVVAEQTVGRGRVLYLGSDALWKWQTLPAVDGDGRTPYEKLWQQTLRAFTPTRTTVAPMHFDAERSRYESGERVVLRAHLAERSDVAGTKLEASIVLPDDRRLPLPMEPDAESPDGFIASFDAATPGLYRLTATSTVDGQVAAQATTAVVVTAAGSEADDQGVDHAALARIASRTGGKVVDIRDSQTWPTSDEGSSTTISERHGENLWNDFALVTLLSLVLGADWLLRLMRGFV
jgi:hypothetical protein